MEVSKRKTFDHWIGQNSMNKTDHLEQRSIIHEVRCFRGSYLEAVPICQCPPHDSPRPVTDGRQGSHHRQKVIVCDKRLTKRLKKRDPSHKKISNRMTTISIIVLTEYLLICSPFFKYSFVELVTLLPESISMQKLVDLFSMYLVCHISR